MRVCARSWRGTPVAPLLTTAWDWCNLPAGHPQPCHSNGVPKPLEAVYYEDDPDYQAELEKERLDEQKAIAKKAAKKLGDQL